MKYIEWSFNSNVLEHIQIIYVSEIKYKQYIEQMF